MNTEPGEREEAPPPTVSSNNCPVSTHEFKLHDWRWLGWPLSNPASKGCWCRLCGFTHGEPEGQCQTATCLEYAAGGNDFCESCQQNRMITDAATRMRERCAQKLRERASTWRKEHYMNDLERRRFNAYAEEADNAANALESLTLDGEKER